MNLQRSSLVSVGCLALLLSCTCRSAAQTTEGTGTLETINVTSARPVARAMDVIEQRYGVLIDYVDPRYAAPQDVEGISYRPGRLTIGPRIRDLAVQYVQAAGKPTAVPYLRCTAATLGCSPVTTRPEGGITALIRKVLTQFAADGGQIFAVKKMTMSYGPRWEVYPIRARDKTGTVADQPDVLSAIIHIPKEDRTLAEMLGRVCQQLTLSWGQPFSVGMFPLNIFARFHGVMGADNVTARRALAGLMGQSLALRLFYGPDGTGYVVSMVNLPYRPPPRPSAPKPAPAVTPHPMPRPIFYWLGMAERKEGVVEIQKALASAGFLRTTPTDRWNANATDAIRRFQAANGLSTTGSVNFSTVAKLEPFLPKFTPTLPPPDPLGPALEYWLQNTRRGRTDIQRALAEQGFYSGPTTGEFDLKTRNALKTYQSANGLAPTGLFDHATAMKLAPLLLKMKD